MAAPIPSLTLAPSSAAASDAAAQVDAGDFYVDFGDKNAPDGAATSGMSGLATDVIKGIVIAVLAKFAFEAFK